MVTLASPCIYTFCQGQILSTVAAYESGLFVSDTVLPLFFLFERLSPLSFYFGLSCKPFPSIADLHCYFLRLATLLVWWIKTLQVIP